jgi:multidrug efflux pump subunit AcrA (membrane-fusion protein)
MALAVCATLLLISCSPEAKPEEPVVTVGIAQAKRGTIQDKVDTEAIVFAIKQASLVPKVSAPVREFYVNRGSHVHKGELLAVLDNRDLAGAAQESKGAYEQAQANYKSAVTLDLPEEVQKAKADLDGAKKSLDAEQKVFDSRKRLYEEGALPRRDWDQAGVALELARNQYSIAANHMQGLEQIGKTERLKSATGQLDAAKGRLADAEAQLSYSEIRSPIDGVVTDRPLFQGEVAAAGAPLITVMDVSEIIAKAHVSQRAAARMKAGDPATILNSDAGSPVTGKITMVSAALDPGNTTVEVWVQAHNPGEQMKPGSSVGVSIVTGTIENAIVVPAAALLASGNNVSVMVAGADGRAHQRPVKPGVREHDVAQIVNGLAAGEWVVTAGAYGLPDNALLRTENPPGQAQRGTRH